MNRCLALATAAILFLALVPARAGIVVSVQIAPPPLVVYAQPPIPAPGYLWTPGYWAYGDEGYFWVPGTWVMAPFQGALWTPGYWGWGNGLFLWHEGYWGLHVGFYGGVNYGYGYGGVGFVGGRWQGGAFAYNGAVMNVGAVGGLHTYNEPVAAPAGHTSFNGGPGGTEATPTAGERAEMAVHHLAPEAAQVQHLAAAAANRALLASVNHGSPALAATSRAGDLAAPGASATHGMTATQGAPAGRSAAGGIAGARRTYPAVQHAAGGAPRVPQGIAAGTRAPVRASAPAPRAPATRGPQSSHTMAPR